MLDTIVLTLDRHQFEIPDPDRFSPSARGLLEPPYYRLGARGNFSCFQNPTKQDHRDGRYLPRLTLAKRARRGGFIVSLRIEFSAPKLLFGNNFDELAARDFERVLLALHRALAGLGVVVPRDILRAAPVSAIHYSKNIAFTDYTTCSMVMSELNLIDLDQRLDLSHTDYRNNGHAIRYHANSFEVTFYDKLKDLEKARFSEKRAVEGDYGTQIDLFKDRSTLPKGLEVLRMEVRLGTRARIMGLVGKFEPEIEPTFAALFHMGLSRAILLRFWSQIQAQMPLHEALKSRRPEDLLALLAMSNEGKARVGSLLQQLGCLVLVGSVGYRGAGALVSRHCTRRSWQRYKRQMKALPLGSSEGFTALKQVDESLRRFQPLCIADYIRA